ncbi:MAG: hypothetical protein ACOY81_00630 [Bacillota bacterium]
MSRHARELINAAIAGIGTYVPGQVLTNAEAGIYHRRQRRMEQVQCEPVGFEIGVH